VHSEGGGVLLSGLRVFVVDDHADSVELFPAVLGSAGAQVQAFRSALEALDAFAALRPDVLVCDLAMPGLNGFELIRRLRAAGWTNPAVAVSAMVRAQDKAEALAAGFDMHLAKPVDIDALVEAVVTLSGRTGDTDGLPDVG